MDNKIKYAAEQLTKIISLENVDMTKDSDPNKIMAAAYGKLDEVVIAGTDKEGNFWFSSSVADGGTVLWLIEHLKMQLLGIKTDDE